MAEYIRNYGGYTLTPDQLSQLKTILDAQQAAITANPSGSGLGIPIYEALLSYISTTETIILPDGPPVEIEVPKPGVDQAVWNFIGGAIQANSNVGFVAAFATNYTADQYTERGGQGDGVILAREASNQIALNLANDVIDHGGSVPGIEGIGIADGSAGAQKVFDRLSFYPNGDYAGWVGTLLFPYIGESNFYNNWLLNTEPFSAAYEGNTTKFKNTPGAYDVVAALDADWTAVFDTAATAASNFDIKTLLQGFFTFVGGPAGATADPSALIKTTNQFFQAYYGLTKDSEFLPGTDLPFAQGPLNLLGRGLSGTGFPQSQYVVGTFTADDKLTAPKDNKQAVIVGGPNDDVIRGTASGDDLIDGGGGNNTIFAGGANDIIFGGTGNNILYGTTIANSTARDVLAGGAGDAVKADQVANPDQQVSPPPPGSSTIYAGTGDNIIIGSGGTDTFNIDATQNINSIDVVWDNGGTDTLNVAGKAYIIEVSDPNATLQSVENVDEFKLAKQYAPQNGNFTGPLSTLGLDAPVVIVINPSKKDTLNLDPSLNGGGSLGNVSPVKGGGVTSVPNNFESSDILTAPPNEIFGVVIKDVGSFSTLTYNDAFNDFPGQVIDPAGDTINDVLVAQPHQSDGTTLIGFTNGDFGIQFENGGAPSTNISTETIIGDGDHDFSALFPEDSDIDAQNGGEESPNFPPDISSTTTDNSTPSPVLPAFFATTTPTVDLQQFQQQKGGGSGGGGGGPNETDQPIVLSSQISDTLVSITAATASGFSDTLIAGNATADTLVSTGFENTLVGNAAGSTLDGSAGFGTVALYKPGNLTIDLSAGTAGVTGSTVSDTLIGITTLAVLGTGDTLIGGPAASTLFSNAGGNTLEGGSPQTMAIYGLDNLTVDLATGTAQVNGASTSDSLVGIANVLVTGQDDTLIGGSGTDVLTSRGTDDTLIAGTGTDTLFSTGTGGTIISAATGNTVEGGFFQGPLAAYFIDDATVDLFTGKATVNGSGVSDTLIAISTVGAFGTNNTLIGGSLSSTLFSNAGGNTVEAGSGSTTAAYALDDVTVDLTAGTATVNGSSGSDTLIGIKVGLVAGAQDTIVSSSGGHTLIAAGMGDTLLSSGTGDTLIANGTADLLMSSGSGNTLVAGSSPATLISTGAGDTLLGGVNGSTLDGSAGTQALAAYDQSGVVVDLATDTAKASPAGPSDTLIGITAAALSGSGSTLIGGGGGDTLFATGANETLLGGSGSNTLSSTGSDNTLIAGAVADVLISTGTNDTLIGNAQGSTLNGSKAAGALAVYGISGVTVDLTTNSASLNGSSVSDTLVGISTLEASGSSETLIGGTGTATLLSDSTGNTLIAGSGSTVAAYSLDNETVDLAAGTASLQGSGVVDRLLGIVDAAISGNEAVAVAGSGGDTLSASGVHDTLIGGSGPDALAAGGISNTLVAGSGNATLSSSGLNNTLIAGAGADTLASAGENDTLFGNAQGSTLTSTAVVTFPTDLLHGGTSQVQLTLTGSGAIAAYALDDVTANLTAGTAQLNGSSVADTLIGITTAAAFGINDTLIGGPGVTTLESNAAGNTLKSGAGQAVAGYLLDNVNVDLAAGTAAVNETATADTLIGINSATVTGTNDTIVGGSVSGTLSANGNNDTLFAGSGTNTLIANGANETLFGNAAGSTLQVNFSASAVAVYNLDDVTVDLSGGKATVNGSNTFDSLQGISVVEALGSNDTLIGGFDSTLGSAAAGNTLEAGFSATTASYALDNLTVNFVAGTAGVNGASLEDTLVGITVARLSGHNDTFVSNGGGDTLTGLGPGALAIYANDNVTVDLAAGTASVAGSSQSDALSGIAGVLLTGNNAVGKAGLAGVTLTVSGSNDTLFGDVNGSTLQATSGASGAAIVYAVDDATVDLSAGIATSSMSAATDTLSGFNAATVSGGNDTLIGGAGAGAQVLSAAGTSDVVIAGHGPDTLSASGTGNTLVGGSGTDVLGSSGTANILIAGSGADTLISTGAGDVLFGNGAGSRLDGSGGTGAIAAYQLDNLTVDLANGTATVNGSGVSDTLVGIASAAVLGKNDTLIAASGSKMLLAGGVNDTIIGAGGTQTLEASGTGDTLLAGGGSDLLSSMGSRNALIGGSGADTLSSSGLNDILIAGGGSDTVSSSGIDNTLIAGSAIDTLSSTGSRDTLFGNAAGSTLDGSAGTGAIAAYSLQNVTVDLATGTASVNGSNVSDTLIGIGAAAALGSNDTLIGGIAATTLISNASGNTLEAGTGQTTASYGVDNVTVNLAAGTATVNGSSVSDLLVGISSAVVSGTNDTLVGDGGTDTLRATGSGDTLRAGTGPDVLSSSGQNNTLIGGSGADTLSSSGSADVLVGGSGADVLSSSGSGNMLIAGSAADTLSSSGSGDALFGNAAGSTLDGSAGTRAIAAYSLNDVTVNLETGTATVNGSTVSDTLVGMTIGGGFGSNDTLIGGSGATTLLSDAAGNTLEAGTGPTTAGYALDNVTVNLAAGSASVNGTSTSDTIIGISSGLVSGSNDTLLGAAGDTLLSGGINNTLIAGSGVETLSSSGFDDTLLGAAGDTLSSGGANNTLIAGSGVEALSSSGFDDTLVGNAAGSTLDGSAGTGATALYSLDNVTVSLAAGTASVNGSTTSDTLIGIHAATVSGANDTLIGDGSGETLSATGSNDIVRGGSGNDTLVINDGTDTFFGGGGNDTFVVLSATITPGLNQPQNLIGDFNPSNANETIDLSHISGVSSFADLSFSTVTFGGQSYLQVALGNTGQAITLAGVTANQLSAGNFLFAAASATPPTLSVQNASGTEDQSIALSISPTETDPNGTLSLTIAGIPADASLSNSQGVLSFSNGSINFTSAQLTAGALTGLTVTPTSADDPTFALHVTATSTDGSSSLSTSQDINVTVAPHADAPTLSVQNASGTEAQPIALLISPALVESGAADPDASLSLTISGIPANAALSNSQGALTVANGSITFTAAQLAAGALNGLAITPASDANFTLSVTATARDGSSVNTTSATAQITVAPLAPILTINGTAQEGQTLTASAQTSDADVTIGYQWQSSSGGQTWTNISGATGTIYTVQETNEGLQLRVTGTATDAEGNSTTATSAASAAVVDIAPTLSVTVGGTAQQGQTLTAAAVANDADAVVTYQWQSLSGTTWSNISGATGSTYTATEADEGNQLRVVATSTDSDGSGATATSAATNAVIDITPTLSVSVSGTAQEGQTLTASAVANDADAVVTYQWQSFNGTTWSNITGATSQTYTAAEADEGNQLRVVATSTDSDGSGTTATSAATAAVVDIAPTLSVTVSGTAQEGQTLTANAVANDADAVVTYQWQSFNGTTWSNISGATATTYTAVEADEGNELRVVATSTDSDGSGTTATSAPTAAVVDIAPTLSVTVSGTAQEGQMLTAVAVANDADAVVSYQWQSLNGTTWSNIAGATNATYTAQEADEGNALRVVATSSDSDGSGTTATSAATAAVIDVTPALSVSLSGNAVEGSTLTATPQATSDADGGTTTYQWQSLTGTTWSNLSGATGSTYTAAETDEGHALRVSATFVDDTGQSVTAISNPTAAVVDVAPTLTVSVSGNAVEGSILTAAPHATSDGDGGTTTYQWQSLLGTTWTNLSGATGSTYTAAETDEGHALRAVATFVDDTGQSVSATSNSTAAVTDIAPTLSVTISGTAQEGQTLTAVPVANDADAVVAYQWQSLSGTTWSNISGAISATYVVAEANETHALRVVATSTDSDGGGASATSAATAAVVDITPTLSVTVAGTAQEGQTLIATAVANDSDAVVKYQWQSLSGSTWSNISGATSATYKIAEATEGQQLRVVATSTDTDGSGTSANSAPTAAVIDVTPTITVTVSGTAQEGSTLTATAHVTGDSDGGTTTYQWQSSNDGQTWVNISGATTTKYKATESDEGNELRAVATFVDDTGQSVSAASSPTAAVADITPTLTAKVTGTAKEGQTLTATATANDADAVLTYQWQSLTGTTWSNISGATGSTYVVAEADETHQLRVVATSTDSDGSGTSATSTATAAVTDIAPTLSVTVSGTVQEGQTLTGTAVANDSDAVITYKWQSSLNGTTWSNISGATSATYTIAEANEGHELRVVATSTDSDGSGTSANSAATAAVTDSPPTLTISNNAITVAAGGSVALPITEASFDSDDTLTVTITGLTSYETVTDKHDSTVFSGNSITLTSVEVASGLTLHSSYGGTGHPVNTLTVTANNTMSGEAVSSAAQTITVTDPPAAPSSPDAGFAGPADGLWTDPSVRGLFGVTLPASTDISPIQLGTNGSDAVLWTSHDPAAATTPGFTGIGSVGPDSGTLGAGSNVVWGGTSNPPSIGAILRGSGGQAPAVNMAAGVGQFGFGALSFADPSPSAGGVLWSAADPTGPPSSGAAPATPASALYLSAPDAVGVGVSGALVPLMSSSTPVNQHPMLGIG
jgi:Ca2+-binding RTX toxin-like protein